VRSARRSAARRPQAPVDLDGYLAVAITSQRRLFDATVPHIDQTRRAIWSIFSEAGIPQESTMTVPTTDKYKDYARYAYHCLMVADAADQSSSQIQREMALEWLRLADAIPHPATIIV
jgi:hypothetical protein